MKRRSAFSIGASVLAACAVMMTAACSGTQSDNEGATGLSGEAAEGISIERFDPALDAIIAPGEVPVKVAGGFAFAEGPIWYDGKLRFSDLTGNKLYELAPGGEPKLIMDKSGGLDEVPPDTFQGSNGQVIDKDGTLLMTQHGARRIVRVDKDMKVTPFLTGMDGARFNSPNDMIFAPDGSLYITDPPYGLLGQDEDPAKEAPYNAVYRYADGKLEPIITDLPRPNAIAMSPDGKKLYISNSEPDMFVNVYDVGPDGKVSNGRRFISYPGPNPIDVPDGIKVDSQGNVWTSGPGGMRIINPEGTVLGQIKTPDRAQANLAWGGDDRMTAYIMGAGNVYSLKLLIPGEKPLYP